MDSFLKILPMIAWAGMVYVMIAQYGTIARLKRLVEPDQKILLKEHLALQEKILGGMRQETASIETLKSLLQDRVKEQAILVWQLKKRVRDAM